LLDGCVVHDEPIFELFEIYCASEKRSSLSPQIRNRFLHYILVTSQEVCK